MEPCPGCSKGSAELAELDLSSLASVRKFIASFNDRRQHLDVLICNAGIMAPLDCQCTVDGVEAQFQVHPPLASPLGDPWPCQHSFLLVHGRASTLVRILKLCPSCRCTEFVLRFACTCMRACVCQVHWYACAQVVSPPQVPPYIPAHCCEACQAPYRYSESRCSIR